MRSPKKLVARVVVSVGLAFTSLVGAAGVAEAGTISAGDCVAGGGSIVDHGAWQGCRGIAPYDIKIV